MRSAVLATRFLLEMCLLGALAAGAWVLGGRGISGALLAVGVAAAAAGAWGAYVGPRSTRRLRDPLRLALEVGLFAAGGAAVWLAWAILPGLALTVASTVIAVLTRAVGEPAPPARK